MKVYRVTSFLSPGCWFRLIYSTVLRLQLGRCGSRFRASYPTVIKGGRNIKIGNNFSSLGAGYIYAHEEGVLLIGDNCSVNTNVQIGASEGYISIGNDVLIGPNVVIRSANHNTSKKTLIQKQGHTRGKIVIQDDVWIGANAVILPGVTLAIGTVVGAGAVVTKTTEPYTVVGGVPARQIGTRS
jgi:galactoside O-acetyltransferase